MKQRRVILVILALAATVGVLFFLRQDSSEPLPQPNGYDDFVKAGQLLSGKVLHWDELPLSELEALVATNAGILGLVRTGLTKECRVPPYRLARGAASPLEALANHKRLAKTFCAEIAVMLAAGRTNDAALSALDCIRFGQQCSRGGPMIDNWTGDIIQRLGLSRLEPLCQSVDASAARKVTKQLEALVNSLEPAADVLRHERRWHWSGRYGVSAPVSYLLNWQDHQKDAANTESKIAQTAGGLRRAILSFATRAYELEKGRFPTSTRELVPAYLQVVPKDFATGLELELTK